MANIQRKLQKNIQKNKKANVKKNPTKEKIINFVKILATIIVLATFMFAITSITSGEYKLDKEEKDSTLILAGETFSKLDKEYYVVFYYFNSDIDINEKLQEEHKKPIYKVDLSSGFNKSIISTESNTKASSVEDLKINDVTLIKIVDGKNVEYISGKNNVINYLETI